MRHPYEIIDKQFKVNSGKILLKIELFGRKIDVECYYIDRLGYQ
jgi:hypothetical protein